MTNSWDPGVMHELALFAGAGGGLLASRLLGHRVVAAVEISPFRREMLLRRQRDGLLPLFPIWDDVRTFDGRPWRGTVDLVSAGFPCQPFSVAGQQRGAEDKRNMWPATIRIIREVRPPLAFLENVPGLLAHEYFGTILGDLAEAGYDAEWCVLGADDLGATHRRKRLWILAYSDDGIRTLEQEGCLSRGWGWVGDGSEEMEIMENSLCIGRYGQIGRRRKATTSSTGNVGNGDYERLEGRGVSSGIGRDERITGEAGTTDDAHVVDADGQGNEKWRLIEESEHRREPDISDYAGEDLMAWPPAPEDLGGWDRTLAGAPDLAPAVDPESPVRRVADGLAHRMDRLAALGDGQVPVVAAAAFTHLAVRVLGGRRG